jgi:hypothetical protein
MKTTFLLFSLILLNVFAFAQSPGDFQSISGGNWGDALNWETYDGGSWQPASQAPDCSQGEVFVYHTMANIPSSLNVGGNLYIFSPTFDMTSKTISGAGYLILYSVSNDVVYNVGNANIGNIIIGGNSSVEINLDGDWGVSTFEDADRLSTVSMSGNNEIKIATAFHNLTIVSGTRVLSHASGTSSVVGAFLLNSGATFNVNGGSITFSGSTTIEGLFLDDNNTGVTTFNAVLDINSGGVFNTVVSSTSVINLIFTAGIVNDGTFNAGAASFTGTQTISGSESLVFNNLVNIGSGMTSGSVTNEISESNGGITFIGNLGAGIATNSFINKGLLVYKGASAPMGSKTLTATNANSIVKYQGSVVQAIKVTAYNHLVIDNSASLTLGAGASVAGSLTFTDGIITNGSNYLTIKDGATVSGASNASHIDGQCRKIGDDAFTFPVGDAGYYFPISISAPASATDHFTAQYFLGSPTSAGYNVNTKEASLASVNPSKYWILNRTAGSSNVSVTLSYSDNVSDMSKLRVARWNGSQWVDHGNINVTAYNNPTLGTITSGTVSSFSPFTTASSGTENTLPVSLMSFDAYCVESQSFLKWSTASEMNSDYFEIERSEDAQHWTVIGSVPAHGNSNQIMEYDYIDKQPLESAFYRLVLKDNNGISHPSYLVSVLNCESNVSTFATYPIPATDIAYLQIPEVTGEMEVKVVDINGREVFKTSINDSNRIKIQIADWKEGIYFVSCCTRDKVYHSKIIKN